MRLFVCLSVIFTLAFAGAQTQPGDAPPETTTETQADAVVLQVGDRALTLEDFDQRFDVYASSLAAQQGIPLTPQTRPLLAQLRPGYLEQVATEFVLLEEAEQRGLEPDPTYIDEQVTTIRESFQSDDAFQSGLEQAGFASEALLRQLIGEAELIRRTLEDLREDIEIRDYQLELYYDANRDRYTQQAQTCARHILVDTREEAEVIEEQLAGGADFAALAQEHSTDTASAARGGDLGCFPRGMMVAPFEEAAFSTAVGEASGIIESRFGHHIILPYERKEASLVPLEDVRDEVRTAVEQMVLTELITGMRETADVEIDPSLVAPETQPTSQPESEPEAQPDSQPESEPDTQQETQPEAQPQEEPQVP